MAKQIHGTALERAEKKDLGEFWKSRVEL